MLFDLERVKENKIRARETRANNFVIKRVFSDFEKRILELDIKWENGVLKVTVGGSVQITGYITVTAHANNMSNFSLTRN